MMLEFRVDKQTLTRRDNERVAANARNFVTCRFEISPDWFAVTPYIVLKAVFERDGEAYGVLLDGDRQCYLPHEAVCGGGLFWVSLVGLCADDEGTPVRATSNRVAVRVEESGASETQNSSAPTPSELEQIEMKIAEFGNRPICISSVNAMYELCVQNGCEYYFIWIAPPAELGASGSTVLKTGAIYAVSRNDGGYAVTLAADLNGRDGADGAAGADGKAPVKGEDYFTEADKTELVNGVLAALPTWEGGSY